MPSIHNGYRVARMCARWKGARIKLPTIFVERRLSSLRQLPKSSLIVFDQLFNYILSGTYIYVSVVKIIHFYCIDYIQTGSIISLIVTAASSIEIYSTRPLMTSFAYKSTIIYTQFRSNTLESKFNVMFFNLLTPQYFLKSTLWFWKQYFEIYFSSILSNVCSSNLII